MTKEEIIQQIHETKTCQIKAGETHRFNDIWLVVAEGRIFCRQYSFSERSWRTEFLKNPDGYIKCGELICKVKAIIPEDLETINPKVNEAYIEKYVERLNYYPQIAREATGEKFQKSTMELILEV